MTEPLYRVEIVSIETGEVESVIGTHLPERKVERRIMTGLMLIDREKYFVRDVKEEERSAS